MANERRFQAHRRELDEVGAVLFNRRIALVDDRGGAPTMVRPDSVIVDGRFDERRRSTIAEAAKRLGGKARVTQLHTRGRVDQQLVEFDAHEQQGGRQRRWEAERVAEVLDRLRDLDARPNHVLLAEQAMVGSPAEAPMHEAGDMRFPGHVIEVTSQTSGQPVSLLLNTTRPAGPPKLRPRLDVPGRRRPRVLVIDTGLRTDRAAGRTVEHPDLRKSVTIDPPWNDEHGERVIDNEDEPSADDFPALLDYGAGHGTFVAGVVRQQCPDAEITSLGALTSFCDGDEASVLAVLGEARARVDRGDCKPFDICVMGLGGYYESDDPGLLADIWPDLVSEMLVVAAAGNHDTTRKFFPGALPGVIAVGAVDRQDKAWYSNYGDWVDACAPGIDIVSTYFTDFTETPPTESGFGSRTYTGWATWSGTSFTAPKVAGVLAQEMYLTGCSAHDAWAAMSAPDRFRLPDLGVVVNV